MSGGLINIVDDENLIALRNKNLYTDQEKEFIKLLSIKHDSHVTPIGSFALKIQKYPSDIDINQVVTIKNNNFSRFTEDLKGIVRGINKKPLTYFSDFKAGVDERYPDDKEKFVLRWSPEEILRGYKILPGNKKMTIEEAVSMKGVLKMDIIVYSNGRFIEESTFFILERPDGSLINLPDNFYELFVEALKKDIKKYSQPGPDIKLFKSVKRMWSLARLKRDVNMLRKLKPLIVSNLSLLGQINADLETIILLTNKTNKLPKKEINNALDLIGKNISTIADIPLDYDLLTRTILALKECKSDCKEKIKKYLEQLHDYLLSVINKSALQYMKYINLYPVPLEYVNHGIAGGCDRLDCDGSRK